MSSAAQTTVIAVAIGLVLFLGATLWIRHAWAVSRVRRAASDAEPSIARLERAVRAWNQRSPQPSGYRLPLADHEYPEPRPRTSSRPARSRRRRSYRKRRRW